MDFLISALTGYLLGSIPTAYVVLKAVKGVDITAEGSGNVGAMNSFEVTNSKLVGIFVLMFDALKGLLSVYIPLLFFTINFAYPAIGLLFAVLSHCYNPWLNFKGGRGLATAAGGSLLLFPFLLVVWLVLWAVIFVIKRDILLANILATPASLLSVYLFTETAHKYSFPHADSASSLVLLSSAVLIIIFNKHIGPLKELLGKPGKNDEQ